VSDLGAIEYAIDGQMEVALAQLRYYKKQNDVDCENDAWNSDEFKTRRDGDVGLTTRVFDEQGKFNVMRLVTGNDAQKTRARETLVRLLDLFREGVSEDKMKGGDIDVSDAEDLADRIVKHLKREGATGQVPKPKSQPEGVPLLLDELLFVDTKNSRLLSALLVDQEVKGKAVPGLHRFLTCYGTGKINLNTASAVVLQALFPVLADRDYARGIVDRRRSQADSSGTGSGTPAMSSSSTSAPSGSAQATGNPFTDVNQIADGSVQGLTPEVLQRNGIDPAAEFDVKSDFFSVRVQGATDRTQRDELYVVERVKTDGFRFLLHQERVDPLLETDDDTTTPSDR
jgi:type II secretory pathway component PulK